MGEFKTTLRNAGPGRGQSLALGFATEGVGHAYRLQQKFRSSRLYETCSQVLENSAANESRRQVVFLTSSVYRRSKTLDKQGTKSSYCLATDLQGIPCRNTGITLNAVGVFLKEGVENYEGMRTLRRRDRNAGRRQLVPDVRGYRCAYQEEAQSHSRSGAGESEGAGRRDEVVRVGKGPWSMRRYVLGVDTLMGLSINHSVGSVSVEREGHMRSTPSYPRAPDRTIEDSAAVVSVDNRPRRVVSNVKSSDDHRKRRTEKCVAETSAAPASRVALAKRRNADGYWSPFGSGLRPRRVTSGGLNEAGSSFAEKGLAMSHTRKMDVLREKLELRAERAEKESQNEKRPESNRLILKREGATFRTAIVMLNEVARG